MSKQNRLIEQFKKATERFEEILKQPKTEIIRDAAIKRFELLFDLSWKVTKEWLEQNKGIICRSPKDCFREAYQNGLIAYDDYWLQMTDWRNEAVHTYQEIFADELFEKLPEALKYFQALREKL